MLQSPCLEVAGQETQHPHQMALHGCKVDHLRVRVPRAPPVFDSGLTRRGGGPGDSVPSCSVKIGK